MNLLCSSLSHSLSLSMNEGLWREKNKQKEDRLCSSISSQPPDNSTAIDNQSLISLISLAFSLYLYCSILSFLFFQVPLMSLAKILNLLWGLSHKHTKSKQLSENTGGLQTETKPQLRTKPKIVKYTHQQRAILSLLNYTDLKLNNYSHSNQCSWSFFFHPNKRIKIITHSQALFCHVTLHDY